MGDVDLTAGRRSQGATLAARVPCLDDDTVLRLVVGELAGPALAQIDEHLDRCDDCRALVAVVARGSGAPGPPAALARGEVIGRYVIGDAIGGGAMGVVYAAWDPELDRRVALKVLRDDGAEPGQARARGLREAQAMARLAHPNVVTVHEVGAVDGDRVFVAMELVAGPTLRAWVARPRAWQEVCDAIVQVGRGLAAAHAAGLTHRDVKPDNVIVGDDGRVRVGDFGLAREAAAAVVVGAGDRTQLAGTPAYMAPEVLRGGRADARSDQFGFAVTLFELLHGVRPFAGRTPDELLAAIDAGKLVAPRRPVPSWLAAILARAVSASPEARFPSMDAVLDAIAAKRQARARRGAWATVAAVVASGVTAAVLLSQRRDPAPVVGPSCDVGDARIAAVWNDAARSKVRGAILAVGTPYVAASADRVGITLDAWTAAWAAADDGVCRAVDVPPADLAAQSRCLERRRDEVGALVLRLGAADRGVALHAVDAVEALPSPVECLTLAAGAVDPLPADPDQRATVEEIARSLAKVRAALALGDWRWAQEEATRLAVAATTARHEPTIAEAELARAQALRASGRADLADAAALQALWAAERGHDELGVARAWIALATIAGERRQLDAADERARHAVAALERAGSPPAPTAALTGVRGLIAYNRGDLATASSLLRDALDGRLQLHGDDDVEVARAYSSLGSVARARGDLEEARRFHDLALAIDRRRLGDAHPDVARDLHNVAGVQRLAGELDAALATYRAALAIEQAALGDDHVATALTRNSIGLVLLARRDLDAAEAELTVARDVLTAAHHADRALALHNLGLVAQQRGRHRDALARFGDALEVYRATIGEDAEAPVRLLLDRAVSERALGKLDAAKAGARQARTRARKLAATQGAQSVAVAREATELLEQMGEPETPDVSTDTEPAITELPPTPRDVGVYGSGQAWP